LEIGDTAGLETCGTVVYPAHLAVYWLLLPSQIWHDYNWMLVISIVLGIGCVVLLALPFRASKT
jgi:hypothetical protein